jgi:cell division protein ZapA (FtsZ GTPase activity inhibitor)
VNLSEELRQMSRRVATLAQVAALAEQPDLFTHAIDRRLKFLRQEIDQAAHELKNAAQKIEAPALSFSGEKE